MEEIASLFVHEIKEGFNCMKIAATQRNLKKSQTSQNHVASFFLRVIKMLQKGDEAYMVAIVTRFIAQYL